ncbi:hypothetical protein BO94DRAFT_546339 [Aspergillus sclerotioniger CBS 115572]|uniref:Kinesin light chain n=1 Tax=Aspergillus sclerotioniger CBS 115572 TaxID=1450535 RepID=A0A317WPR2_9EURO|nr:hypothetical protein BO94DRAFT_546339 [Aspergillus sclerotioniger CBS 115572]PWY87097.1 hypothetical protein BO94DRAFT_546339 [Aspergillus sclerotioniger CBS 115572]
MQKLAFTLKQLGKAPDALNLLRRCVDLRINILGSHHPHAISSSNTLRDWETAAVQPSKCQQPHASLPGSSHLNPMHAAANIHPTSASKPVGRKRRFFMSLFSRR